MNWRNRAKSIESKGATTERVSCLADLHARRKATESQYFTPEWVAKGIWQSLGDIVKEIGKFRFASVLDSSIGSARLLEGAPVKKLSIYGIDVDQRCIDALSADAADAELSFEFACIGMEDLKAKYFDFAVINPPFSIHLESPNLTPYSCNSFGRFGQSTSANSHEYALEQALDAAGIVCAILPLSMDSYCRSNKRLSRIVYLPGDTFLIEGANVRTGVYFFSKERSSSVEEVVIEEADNWPAFKSRISSLDESNPRFNLQGVDELKETITLPVTDNCRVEMHHHNRKIVLKYNCGLVQAKVANALLKGEALGKRLPGTIQYIGDGQFLLDVLLMQENPEIQLNNIAGRINRAGGSAWISPTLDGYYKKLIRRQERAVTPMYRTVKARSVDKVTIKAIKRTLLIPGDFNSPSIAKNSLLSATPNGGEYKIDYQGKIVVLRRDELLSRFEIIGDEDISQAGEWTVKHKGLNHHFPHLAKEHGERIDAKGINWLAGFQRESLIEGLISPYGFIGAWEQGSGKARYALALALMHSGSNMIVVESGLMPEMLIEIEKLGLDKSSWKLLKTGDDPTAKINLTTYSTLRSGTRIVYKSEKRVRGKLQSITKTKVVRTNAKQWRRQINTLVCDEGGLLSNLNTQQTQAIKTLAARKLIPLDGTPQRNYPRDLLPLSVAAAGNGVSHQPFGVKGKVYVFPKLIDSATLCERGEDRFYDQHVVTQWVTNEFKEDLQAGAKREVPKINNLSVFRDWLAPNIQRRLRAEPDLDEFNNCPKPLREVLRVDWDDSHLSHYIKTALEFANWYKQDKFESKGLNLVAVLARIGAVQRAANSPHVDSASSMDTYEPLTTKQELALERIEHWVGQGRKTIVYAKSPEVLERLVEELKERNIDSVLFTGKQDIKKRAKVLNDEFRNGTAPVLASSWVGQRGLNLPEASAIIFYERDWSATTEEQAIFRTQRPSQTMKVIVEYLHLTGSIDEYCAQLVEWKSNAANAGLDFGDQTSEEEEFLHLDTLLTRFCDEVLNTSIHEFKDLYAA